LVVVTKKDTLSDEKITTKSIQIDMNTDINNQHKPTLDENSSSSLVARAGQVMVMIITLGLCSMISSMLVTESLSGDAHQINQAGALRMQALRISRANLIDDQQNKNLIANEVAIFEKKMVSLFSSGLSSNSSDEINVLHEKIVNLWKNIKQNNNIDSSLSIESFDRFVITIDALVNQLQLESEKKLNLLRLIQSISVLSILLIAGFVLFKLNRTIITPLKQLVTVAAEVGNGNFDSKIEHDSNDELGVLSRTINQMSTQLKSTYQDFEDRVDKKTQELRQSNQSLEVLYRAARKLSNYEYHQIDQQIIAELEQVLGVGKVSIELSEQSIDNLIIYKLKANTIDLLSMNVHQFVLEKRGHFFGDIVWQLPKTEAPQTWQKQILQTMADIIATAIELEQKRNTESRLIIAEERAVISRELHDSLAQSLAYLKVQMSLLTRKMQKQLPEEQINETIEDIKQGLNNAYLQLRELLTTFRLKLEDPSIENALKGTISEFSEKCQHPIALKFELPQNYLSPNQEIHLLQIIREALSNIHRHAQASKAGVLLLKEDNIIKLEIWDNGNGLPQHVEKYGHFGLSIMEERAKSLNTLIRLEKNQPQGTKVSLEFSH